MSLSGGEINRFKRLLFVKARLSRRQVQKALKEFKPKLPALPSMPPVSLQLFEESDRPQPRLDRDLGRGYTVAVGGVRKCNVLDFKFTLLSHNCVIGAAGGSILNAELALVRGYLK